MIQPFWIKIQNFIKNIFEVNFPISDAQKYFGIENPSDDKVIDSINFIILAAKTFVWREKRLGKPCYIYDFLPYLTELLLLDNATQLFKRKPFISDLLEML